MRTNALNFHERALIVVNRYRKCEVALVELLQRADDRRIYGALGYNSLFRYACEGWGLSEEIAYTFINVARKARQVPALKEAIRSGRISITKAKKISAVLTVENQQQWLTLAATLPKSQLEREVAKANPREAVVESVKFVSGERLELKVGISQEMMLKLRRAQDVLSQKRRAPVGLEDVLGEAVALYLKKQDPLQQRSSKPQVPGPVERLPKSLKRQVIRKFGGQCAHVEKGVRCKERRFLEVHHKVPLSQGGTHDLSNLKLLCSGHHRAKHLEAANFSEPRVLTQRKGRVGSPRRVDVD